MNLRILDFVSKYRVSSSEAMSMISTNTGCLYIPRSAWSVPTTKIRRCPGSATYASAWVGSVASAVAELIGGMGFGFMVIGFVSWIDMNSTLVRSNGLPDSSRLIDITLGINCEGKDSLLGRSAFSSNL